MERLAFVLCNRTAIQNAVLKLFSGAKYVQVIESCTGDHYAIRARACPGRRVGFEEVGLATDRWRATRRGLSVRRRIQELPSDCEKRVDFDSRGSSPRP